MTWVVALHRKPDDPAAYMKHYSETHIPLAKALPGLRRFEVSKGGVAFPGATSEFLLVALLQFDSVEAVQAAIDSPQGQAALADTHVLAPNDGDLTMLLFDTEVL